MLRTPKQNCFFYRKIPALRVALIYALFSVLWILFSDQLLLLLVMDPTMMTRIQMVKGWVFVFVTSLIIYALLLREISRVIQAERALSGKERDYREVFNATNEGIIIHDAETGRMVDVNLLKRYLIRFTPQKLWGRVPVWAYPSCMASSPAWAARLGYGVRRAGGRRLRYIFR